MRAITSHIYAHSSNPPNIYVASIPTAGDDLLLPPDKREDNQTRNKLIAEWLESNPYEGMMKMGPRIDVENYEYRRRDIYWKDMKHFSRAGYGMVAKDLFLIMKDDIVKREFKVFR